MSVSNRISKVDGQLNLSFDYSAAAKKTTLRTIRQIAPLRVVRAFHLKDGTALVHLHNVSGGVLGGDQLSLTVMVKPGARAQLTTPGATRVYRHRPGQPVTLQQNCITVQAGGLLEYLPDPLIPFAQARYRQTTRIELAEGAGLFWWEIVAPGREARDELFAYDYLEMMTDIIAKGRPIALERLKIEPAAQPLSSMVRLGTGRYFATFYICRVGAAPAVWLALEQELTRMARQHELAHEIMWGVSTLAADGLVVRALSRTGRAIQAGLVELWRLARRRLYNDEITPPRKLY